jgi:putative ABC transport system substrate-binding protein
MVRGRHASGRDRALNPGAANVRAFTRRRVLVAGGALVLVRAVPPSAQPSYAPPRVGLVAAASAKDVAPRENAFREGMRERGYEHGRNLLIDPRYAEERIERIPQLIEDLVRANAAVIVSAGPTVTRAARQVTSTVPIVMAFDADPVGSGAVASLARPGGNVTGLSILATDLTGKQLEYLKALVPKLARVAVFENPAEPGTAEMLRATRQAAAVLGLAIETHDVGDPARIEGAFAAARAAGADGVVVMSSPFALFHRKRFAEAAAANRLPAFYPYPDLVDAGGLMSYGVVIEDLFRRSATYVDRILRGAKAADLPIELPRVFVFVVNVPAAKRIGLAMPPSLLARADRIVR